MELALAHGHADVDGMLDGIDSRQLAEWQQYFSRRPFGLRTISIQLAVIATLLAVSAGNKDATVETFLPGTDPENGDPDDDEFHETTPEEFEQMFPMVPEVIEAISQSETRNPKSEN